MGRATKAILLLVWTVSACGGQAATGGPASTQATPASAQPTSAPPQATVAPPSANAGGTGSSVAHVVVGGGPQAGTYDGTSPKVDCNLGATGSGATYQDLAKTNGMSGLTFIAGEGGASPTKLYIQLLFGPVTLQQPTLEIMTLDPASAKGSAKAQLEDTGGTINWTFDGRTADGVSVTGTVECGPVDRN